MLDGLQPFDSSHKLILSQKVEWCTDQTSNQLKTIFTFDLDFILLYDFW